MTDSEYLKPGRFIESQDPVVIAFARDLAGEAASDTEKALKLFYALRDDVLDDPYMPLDDPKSYSAKAALESGRGWCVPKSALLTAAARAVGIKAGNKRMEYIRERGTFQDVPIDLIQETFNVRQPGGRKGIDGNFQKEVAEMNTA